MAASAGALDKECGISTRSERDSLMTSTVTSSIKDDSLSLGVETISSAQK